MISTNTVHSITVFERHTMHWLFTARLKTLTLLSIVLLLVAAAPLLEGKLYECAVGCDNASVLSPSSVGKGVSLAGVSPAAVALAVTALQAAGVQVRCCMVAPSMQWRVSLPC
jgi:hypothetical protein